VNNSAAKTNPQDLDPESWLEDHGDALYRFALLRVKSPELAEDLVQDTLVSAIRAKSQFEGKSSIRTWLIQILKNKIIDFARKQARQATQNMDEELEAVVDANFHSTGLWNRILPNWAKDPGELIEQREFYEALTACLSNLPERSRHIFMQKVVDGCESEDICKSLDISSSNLWVILHRARLALRDCMEIRWFGKNPSKT
jgi:RNA polymerase sigma-70 factor (ECF subfamily)